MSVHVSSWVWKYSKAESTQLLVLLALADQANDDGECWPSVKTIAARCRLKGRAVQENIRLAEQSGELVIRYQEGPHGTNIYQFPSFSPDAPSRTLHLAHPAPGRVLEVQNGAPESVREPSIETKTKSVAVTSLASPADSVTDILDKLTEEFGLSRKQGREAEMYPEGYILEKAAIVRSKPRENMAASFMSALSDDWKAPVSTVKPKLAKYWKAEPVEGLCAEEKAKKELAALRSSLSTSS